MQQMKAVSHKEYQGVKCGEQEVSLIAKRRRCTHHRLCTPRTFTKP